MIQLNKAMQNKYIFIIILCLVQFKIGLAQDKKITNDVQVIGPYQPTISDAYKINVLPKIIDTTKVTADIDYSIVTRQINTGYELDPIVAASMLGEPLTKLYNSFIKLGFGNYYTPFFQFNYHSLRSKVSSFGVNMGHISSNSKIKLANNEKVDASYSNNYVSVFGKRFFNKKTLSGDVNFRRTAFHHYGYDVNNDSTDLTFNNYKQNYMLLNANTVYQTNYTDENHLNYKISGDYNYLMDINNFYQHSFTIAPDFNKYYNGELFGIKADANYYLKNQEIDTVSDFILRLNPYAKFSGKAWKVNIGLSIVSNYYNQTEEYHFYPNVYMHYHIVQNILIPYIGVDGDLEKNDYKKIAFENPYILPSLIVKNTNRAMQFYGGFKGNFSSKTSFNFRASYAEYKDMYFYVNNLTADKLLNQFSVEYDNADLVRVFGEISSKPSEKFEFLLHGNYYYFNFLEKLDYAWHKPEYDVTLTASYNLRNKIILTSDFFVLGKRYAKSYNPAEEKITLKEIFDLNLGVEYRYTKILSAFINFNNIAAQKYYKWNNYPTQRFNIIAGVSYSM